MHLRNIHVIIKIYEFIQYVGSSLENNNSDNDTADEMYEAVTNLGHHLILIA